MDWNSVSFPSHCDVIEFISWIRTPASETIKFAFRSNNMALEDIWIFHFFCAEWEAADNRSCSSVPLSVCSRRGTSPPNYILHNSTKTIPHKASAPPPQPLQPHHLWGGTRTPLWQVLTFFSLLWMTSTELPRKFYVIRDAEYARSKKWRKMSSHYFIVACGLREEGGNP
jgi:hypothetical protein